MKRLFEWLIGSKELEEATASASVPAAVASLPVVAAEILPAKPTIKIVDKREDPPEFERVYTGYVLRGIKVQLKIYRSGGSGYIYQNGELTQPNGKWVLFSPDRIADQIIDPVLLPEVQRMVSEMQRLDREFRKNPPTFFIDERGTKWSRIT